MIAPNLLRLPVFSDFHFVLKLTRLLLFEILLCGWHTISVAVGIVEYVLALADERMAFVLPEDGPAIISATGEEGSDTVPADAVDGLLVVAELGEFLDGLHFLLVE